MWTALPTDADRTNAQVRAPRTSPETRAYAQRYWVGPLMTGGPARVSFYPLRREDDHPAGIFRTTR